MIVKEQVLFNNLIRFLYLFLCIQQIRQVFESIGFVNMNMRAIFTYSGYLFHILIFLLLVKGFNGFVKKNEFLILTYLMIYPFITLFFYFNVNYSIQYMLTDTLLPFVFFCSILISWNSKLNFEIIYKTKFLIFYFIVCVLSILISLNYEMRYQSLAAVPLLFCTIVLHQRKKTFSYFLSYILIFLSGKRGLLSIVFYNLKFKNLLMLILIFSSIIFLNLIPSKYIYYFLNLNDFSFSLLGVAREMEIVNSWSHLSGINHLTGLGAGYFYFVYDSNLIKTVAHNVHFSPVGFYTTYGVIYTITVYVFLINYIIKRRNINKIFFSYIIIALIYSFTAYSVFVDILLLLSIIGINKKNVRN